MSIQNRTYKDVSFNFFANPMSGDIGKSEGAKAVTRAMIAIIKTNFHERLFQPRFGSNIRSLLFEHMSPLTEERLRTEITNAITRHEPRANLLHVAIESQEEQNRYRVSILYDVSSESAPQKLETYFERA